MADKKEHNFEIGQIIYLLSEDAEAIVPAFVIEEQIIKKLEGNSVSWKVAVGPPNKRKEVDSIRLKGEIHTSLENIREAMTQRLNDFIDNLISEAKKKTEVWYGQQILEKAKDDGSGGKIDPAVLLSSIDNNNDMFVNKKQPQPSPEQQKPEQNTFRVKAPLNNRPLCDSNPNNPLVNIDPSDPKANLKRQLLEMATPDEEEAGAGEFNGEYVITEDGRQVPVKYNINQ